MSLGHRRILWLVVLGTVPIVAGSLWLLWPRTAITQENAERIQAGMTLAEVEVILGGPERDESTPGARQLWSRNQWDLLRALNSRQWQGWRTDSLVVYVSFDESTRVLDTHWGDSGLVLEDSLFYRLRRWIGLQ
jgi:hypothetical protein